MALGAGKVDLHRKGSGGRTTQLRPAANNLAAPGIFSSTCLSCMYKSACNFPYSAFWENVLGLTGVVLVCPVRILGDPIKRN